MPVYNCPQQGCWRRFENYQTFREHVEGEHGFLANQWTYYRPGSPDERRALRQPATAQTAGKAHRDV